MHKRAPRVASIATMLLAVMLAVTSPGLYVAAESASDEGSVTVQIVPPGTLPTTPAPAESSQPTVGTLSAQLMWLPDPVEGSTGLHGMIAVQDHRARADGWTVRLSSESGDPGYLIKVTVGETGFGLPDWVYEAIHTWDVAVGAPMAESPQIITAPPRHGYGLSIHQVGIDVDPATIGLSTTTMTLVLMLPFAP